MDVTCHKKVTPAFHMNVSQVCHIKVNVLTQVCFKDYTTASTRMPPLCQKDTIEPNERHRHKYCMSRQSMRDTDGCNTRYSHAQG